MINNNLAPILHRFRDIAADRSEIAILGYPSLSRKRCKIGGKLVLISNRKYMTFRLLPKSVILSDLERYTSRYFASFQRIRVPSGRTAWKFTFAISSPDEFLLLLPERPQSRRSDPLLIICSFQFRSAFRASASPSPTLLPSLTTLWFLANVNSRSRSLYAIARPSVVCL